MTSIKDLKPEIKRIFVDEDLGPALKSLKAALPENSKVYKDVLLLDEREAYTEWIFFIRALREGQFSLMLRVAVVEKVGEKERKRDIVLEEKVRVVSHPISEMSADSFKTTGYRVGISQREEKYTDSLVKHVESPELPSYSPPKSVPLMGPVMVFVKGGTFTMGCTDEQGSDCNDREKPKRQVTVGDFKIGKYEVTQAEWKTIMGSNPSELSGCDNCPVENVSWDDAQEFINKLNQKTGGNYRLPTETEWEYAARGGQKKKETQYAGSNNIDEVAWWLDNSRDKRLHPVGLKKPNELGIYDMSGNVWEWCADHWHENYNGAPTDGSAWVSGGDSTRRVVRGGGNPMSGPKGLCVYERFPVNSNDRHTNLGFRLARD